MQQKSILMICLLLGLLISSSSNCGYEDGGCLGSPSRDMYINNSSYDLIFKYGNENELILELSKNDTVKLIDEHPGYRSLLRWTSSGNHNEMMYGDSIIILTEYVLYSDSTTIEDGIYYRTCKFSDSLINDIKDSMAIRGFLPKKLD